MTPLDYNRLVFQNDPDCKVIIATYKTGSAGVTFTAASAVVMDDYARDYTQAYQAEDRAHRIDNIRKKYEVQYYSLLAKYPKEFLERMKGLYEAKNRETGEIEIVTKENITDRMRALEAAETVTISNVHDKYFSQGTYDQVHRRNLDAQKRVFELVMDGVKDANDLEQMTNTRIKTAMPFLFEVSRKGREQGQREEEVIEEEEALGDEDGNGENENGDTDALTPEICPQIESIPGATQALVRTARCA
ncbi:MAG: hypothetical protein HY767_00895 [Candidatus Omnitrophica bacterium]|nr:hypothetical protein [Candidatus Omnitrophota bacterium]